MAQTTAALPDTLPSDPMPVISEWLADASKHVRNATAMTLATIDTHGRPAARMVICRGFDAAAGTLVFYTDRDSDKGGELARCPWAALVFHWEALERQVRITGPVTHASDAESDAYWASRPLDARVAAVASDQSRPLASRAALLARMRDVAARVADDGIPRPHRWGGYRVWAERVELWVSQPARAHDRARWTRSLTRQRDAYVGGPWNGTRLMP